MKRFKKYISALWAIQLMLATILIPNVYAADEIVPSDIKGTVSFYTNSDGEIITISTLNNGELSPATATDCPSVTSFDWSNSHHWNHQSVDETKESHGVFSDAAFASLGSLTPSGALNTTISGSLGTYVFYFPNAGIHYSFGNPVGTCNYITVRVNLVVGQVITAFPSM